MTAGLNAVDRQQHARDEVADLLFDSEDDDTEDDFSGFVMCLNQMMMTSNSE